MIFQQERIYLDIGMGDGHHLLSLVDIQFHLSSLLNGIERLLGTVEECGAQWSKLPAHLLVADGCFADTSVFCIHPVSMLEAWSDVQGDVLPVVALVPIELSDASLSQFTANLSHHIGRSRGSYRHLQILDP